MHKLLMAGALLAAACAPGAHAASLRTVFAIESSAQVAAEDQKITHDVVTKLSNDSNLEGKIGVTTKDGEVTLEGIVTTAGQVEHAERDAEGVEGVSAVHNHVNAWVGQN